MKNFKNLFTALMLLCCMGTATAQHFEVDGIYYNITNRTDKTVCVTYRGISYNDYYNEYTGSVVIPESVSYDGKVYSVTSIGDYAFWNCTGLTSVVIPNSVTSIGEDAFLYCAGLTSIKVESGNSFYDSRENCNAIIETATKTLIKGCNSTIIPNSVTSIGDWAFEGCSGLTSITIPNSVTSIGETAFSWCTGLTSITIGNSVTSIGNYAFRHCTGLTSVTIPNSVKSIRNDAFWNCTGLKEVHISDLAAWCGIDFGNASANPLNDAKNLYLNDELVTALVIPDNVTNIRDYAFYYCTGLKSITIPNSVTSIGMYAFDGCKGLKSVTIGTGVKDIGLNAFAKCSNLTDVYCLATSVPSTNATAFNESYPEYMTLHVPEEAINRYKATAPWSSFGTVVTLDGDVTETPKCATPTVLYINGKLHFECETEGAEFVTEITSSDFNKFYNNDINLTATYNISVYATATGYGNSDIVNATLCWVECECEGDDTGIINIPAKAVLVTSSNGSINISCSLNEECVAVYTTSGTLIATTTIENGTATVATRLSKGSVAIVNIAGKSIKVAVN